MTLRKPYYGTHWHSPGNVLDARRVARKCHINKIVCARARGLRELHVVMTRSCRAVVVQARTPKHQSTILPGLVLVTSSCGGRHV